MFKTMFAAAVIASLTVCSFAKPAEAQGPIGNTGRVVTGAYFDYSSGTWVVNTDQRKLYPSALDPNRDAVDPGSYQNVNYTQWDNGTLWQYTGARWTSYGVPHSTVTRQSLSQAGNSNVYVNQSETQYRSSRGGRQASRNSDIRPQGSTRRHAGW